MNSKKNESLLTYNTFGIDVRCEELIRYDSVAELQRLVPSLQGRRYLHIGGGSNLLFLSDFDGVILKSDIVGIDVISESETEVILRAGAAIVWDDFVDFCTGHGYYGLENLSLIPGEVGASAVQNIGAYGAEAADRIVNVELVDLRTGELKTMLRSDCSYGYRHSIFKEDGVRGCYAVTHVTYRLDRTFKPALEYGGIRHALVEAGLQEDKLTAMQLRQTIIDIRRHKLPDPKVTGNAGSFFMNPVVPRLQFEDLLSKYPQMPHYEVDDDNVKIPAGWLIDQCGWKGKTLGPAGVHPMQALVLVNCGGATGADIVSLCDAIRNDVQSQFGIAIHPEVNFI